MHERQSPRRKIGKFPYRRAGGWRDAAGTKHFLGSPGGLDDVGVCQGRTIAGMSKEISAKQRACGFFK